MPVVGSSGNAQAPEFILIILSVQHVPLFAAFQDFFLLRGNAFADFQLDLFLVAEHVGQDLNDLLANRVAVINEFHFVAGHQHLGDLVRESDNFFTAQSQHSCLCSLLRPRSGKLDATCRYRRTSLRSRARCCFTFLYISWYDTPVLRISSWRSTRIWRTSSFSRSSTVSSSSMRWRTRVVTAACTFTSICPPSTRRFTTSLAMCATKSRKSSISMRSFA